MKYNWTRCKNFACQQEIVKIDIYSGVVMTCKRTIQVNYVKNDMVVYHLFLNFFIASPVVYFGEFHLKFWKGSNIW